MSSFKFSARSRGNLEGVHPDLVAVMERALEITPIDFIVIEGLRTKERQRELVRIGQSWTMNSRHLTGHAVDLLPIGVGGPAFDWPLYYKLAPAVKEAALELDVDLEWGGDWSKHKDGPHFQLAWDTYPIGDTESKILPPEKPKAPAGQPTGGFAALIRAILSFLGRKA